MDDKIKVWNLICLEEILVESGQSIAAYNVRLILDLISSNWREVIKNGVMVGKYQDLEIHIEGK